MARVANILALCASLLWLSVVNCPPARADEVALSASVDKTEASLDDYIVLKVSVEGTREEPRMPDLGENFKFQSRGTSSQMTIINGRMSSKLEYNYILYPQKAGTFTIGAFTISDGSAQTQSNTLQVTITRSEPQPKDTGEVFVSASVDTQSPFLNQQIIYTFQFCRRVKVTSASLVEQPTFDGFLVENLGKEHEFQKVINGQQYVVTEIKQALFPLKTGELEITPTTLQAAVATQGRSRRGRGADPFFDDSFFGFTQTVPKNFRTEPVKISVKPLPVEGRPADFKNLVGQFSLSSQLSSAAAKVGDSLTLTITISGTGSLKNLQTLDLGPLDNFKIYDDKPVFEPAILEGRVGGTLTIKKALVPLVPGALRVPAAGLSYFDTAAQSYKTLRAAASVVQVSPSAAGEKLDIMQSPGQAGSQKQDIELLARDILPIRTAAGALQHQSLFPSTVQLLLLFLPPLFFMALLGAQRYRERSLLDSGASRQKNAYKVFISNMARARKALDDENRFYQAGAKALKDYLGDKLNIAGQALAGNDLDVLLTGKIPPESIAGLKAIMDFFDAGQFGFKHRSPLERTAALDTMQALIHQLNRVLRL